MIEEKGDIFGRVEGFDAKRHEAPWIVIPTNADRKASGAAVMGAGVAQKAAMRWFWLPTELGEVLRDEGSRVVVFKERRAWVGDTPADARTVVVFPTKGSWRKPSSLELVVESAKQLAEAYRAHVEKGREPFKVLLPRVGAGLGGLAWHVVRDAIKDILSDDVFVVRTP